MGIDTMNKFAVGSASRGTVILNPPRGPMPKEDALLLAAYLVVLSGASRDDFGAVLDAVEEA